MMVQGPLPYQYAEAPDTSGLTALAGLPVYLDLARVLGLSESVRRRVKVRAGGQGWTDEQILMSLVLLNLAGGSCVDDLRVLQEDLGFCRLLERCALPGLNRQQRREQQRRWRKEKRRSVPSPSAVFRYLEAFHEEGWEKDRVKGKAWIPSMTEALKSMLAVNRDLLAAVQRRSPETVATLDMDATLVRALKEEALFCYQGHKSYQPLNVRWWEQRLVVYSEFRDGNVPAGFENLRVFKEALRQLPEGVKTVRLRTDTAGYEHRTLQYCELGKDPRFGRIEFAIGCDVTPEFKKCVAAVPEAEWKPLMKKVDGVFRKTGQEWAEVPFAPDAMCNTKRGTYRFLAIREALSQPHLPGMAPDLPFPVMPFGGRTYKLFGTVTNLRWEGGEVIRWHRLRCGASEEAHSVMKEDLAGGTLPSGRFGVNAAWWAVMILSLNLNEAMKRLVLGGTWATRRLKSVRFSLINLPGRVVERAGQVWVCLARGTGRLGWLLEIRGRISALSLPLRT